ncbi:MAG: hypothetical protein LBQ02_03215 [Candidatus Nomurabacteria bacterium]|jgi:hypothetical protein|nr:hypothetical protein [Candidatus Nomurabacteria bacterium]
MGSEVITDENYDPFVVPKKVHVVSKSKITGNRLDVPEKELSKLFRELTPKEIRVEYYNIKHVRQDAVKLLKRTFESVMSGNNRLKKNIEAGLTLGEIVEIGDILEESA